jgi:hypothetical protein
MIWIFFPQNYYFRCLIVKATERCICEQKNFFYYNKQVLFKQEISNSSLVLTRYLKNAVSGSDSKVFTKLFLIHNNKKLKKTSTLINAKATT